MDTQQIDEKAVFNVARRIADAAARDNYLAQACGDDNPAIQRIQELLRIHEQEQSFLESPAADLAMTTNFQPIAERPGTVIGPYKLLQQIGEGGMGVVYMADQQSPVRRRVALKIIKAGMDTGQVIARFEAERQAVAMMDHPNIAKVLDAGATDTGRPYFVMELVKGVPITRYCDEKHLPLRGRLELFVQVCQAVQHAHQKGIIHRDIKPNNVLVAEYDNRAVPKVIDFGVAKATAQRLTERTMFTEFGQVLGTMEYMSPEQSKFNQLDIDTRSDIYSLGVLLYELLAGSTPFEGKRLHAAAFDEMLRIIREEEPQKPSTRLSSLALGERASSLPLPPGEGRGEGTSDSLPLAGRDQTSTGDPKSPERSAVVGREASGEGVPSSLASIAANRHTEPARLSKDVQGELDWIVMKALEKDRNRRYETASGFAADIERHLHDEPVEAGPPSAMYRLRKFVRRNKATMLVTAVIAASLIAATTVSVWQAAIAREALRLAETRLESETRARKEADAAKVQAKNEATRAEAETQKATTSAQTAQAVIDFLNRDLLGQAHENVPRDKHNSPDGELTLRGALDRAAEKLEGRFPDKPLVEAAIRHMIGATYWSFGDDFHHQAEPHLARALELRRIHLGEDQLETIGSLMVLSSARRDVQLQRVAVQHARRALGEEHDLTRRCKFNLAFGLRSIGQDAEAISLFREVLAAKRRTLGSQHPETAWTAHCLATTLNRAADTVPANDREIEDLYREALSVSFQSRGDWSWHTMDTTRRLGQFLRSRGRLDEAEKVLKDGYARLESGPTPVEWAFTLIAELEALYQEWGKPDQAAQWRQKREVTIEKGLARNSRLLRENLNDPGLLISHASLLWQIGQHDEAEAAYRLAVRLQPDDPRARHLLGDSLFRRGNNAAAEADYRVAIRLAPADDWHHSGLGHALFRQSKFVEAEAEFRESIRLQPNYAWNHHWLGDALKHQSKWVEAEAAYREAIRLDPTDASRYVNLGETLAARGKGAEALIEFQTAVQRQPTSAAWHRTLGHFLCYTMGEPDKALPTFQEAVRLDPANSHAHYDVGSAYAFTGQSDKATPAFRRAVDLDPNGQPPARYRLATLCLYNGDLDGYRATCREMLERFGTSDDPHYFDCTAKICLLVSDADDNRARALTLADRNVLGTEKHPAYRWFVLAKGLADYRTGRFAGVVKQLEQFAPDAGGGHSDATGFAVLAMAQHGLHQAEKAREALASARAILSNTMPNPAKGRPFGDDWHDWLHSKILVREAEGMIEKEADDSKFETEEDPK